MLTEVFLQTQLLGGTRAKGRAGDPGPGGGEKEREGKLGVQQVRMPIIPGGSQPPHPPPDRHLLHLCSATPTAEVPDGNL